MTKSEKQNEIQGRNKSPLYLELTKLGAASKLFIHNVKNVESFSEEYILLKLAKGALKISGAKLILSIYENASIEIDGEIVKVEFI